MINASIVLKLECICYIVVFLLVVEKHSILYKSLLTIQCYIINTFYILT